MLFQRKKRGEKKLKRGAIPHLFLLMGIITAAVSSEAMNILHEIAKNTGYFHLYAFIVVAILWPIVLIGMIRAIDYLYEEK